MRSNYVAMFLVISVASGTPLHGQRMTSVVWNSQCETLENSTHLFKVIRGYAVSKENELLYEAGYSEQWGYLDEESVCACRLKLAPHSIYRILGSEIQYG